MRKCLSSWREVLKACDLVRPSRLAHFWRRPLGLIFPPPAPFRPFLFSAPPEDCWKFIPFLSAHSLRNSSLGISSSPSCFPFSLPLLSSARRHVTRGVAALFSFLLVLTLRDQFPISLTSIISHRFLQATPFSWPLTSFFCLSSQNLFIRRPLILSLFPLPFCERGIDHLKVAVFTICPFPQAPA